MIELATKNDIPELSRMWQGIFEEDKEVCGLFFKDIFPTAPVIKNGGKIVSALFLLPCSFGSFNGASVYCAMTKSEERGKGYMKKLLDFSYNYIKEKKLDFLFLVPAEKSLFGYYGKCGFIPFGNKQIFKANGTAGSFENVRSCSENEYTELRKNAKGLAYSDTVTKYWVKACVHYGGEAVTSGNAHGLIFPYERSVIIRDVYGTQAGIREILSYAESNYPGCGITAEGKFDFAGSEAFPCGMIRTENKELLKNDYYIGITLE